MARHYFNPSRHLRALDRKERQAVKAARKLAKAAAKRQRPAEAAP